VLDNSRNKQTSNKTERNKMPRGGKPILSRCRPTWSWECTCGFSLEAPNRKTLELRKKLHWRKCEEPDEITTGDRFAYLEESARRAWANRRQGFAPIPTAASVGRNANYEHVDEMFHPRNAPLILRLGREMATRNMSALEILREDNYFAHIFPLSDALGPAAHALTE